VEGKKYWKVSASALNHRLHKLDKTSEYQYTTFCIQIQQRFGQSEPYGAPREVSVIWEKIIGLLRKEGINKYKIAEALSLPVFEIENLVFGLTKMQSIEGYGTGSRKSSARLALV
jgi:hypothetical protein